MAVRAPKSSLDRKVARGEDHETTAEAADGPLLGRERRDLVWLWNQAEADLGVISNFGAAQRILIERSMSDEGRISLGKERRAETRAKRASKSPLGAIMQRSLMLLGIRHEPVGFSSSEQMISVHDEAASVASDPYKDDSVLTAVQKANHIRERLVWAGRDTQVVLHAAFGPNRGGEDDRRAIAKALTSHATVPGELLVEIVVAIAAKERSEGDPPPRTIVLAHLTDGPWLVEQTKFAERLLHEAAQKFANTRCRPVRFGACLHCWGPT